MFLAATALTVQHAHADTFEVGEKQFLLNGKPFVVKAAEVHYSRIPAEYWEHRIEMCKALGMNTICLYAFWNFHEQRPDEYDFTGQRDIAEFCRLAQKHGMYVILRPGPYVCAEWEMGGLPWWLLKKADVKLRTLDPYYIERLEKFMRQMGQQLADMQISRGGNILMVQVENEYGAYATDKPYVSKVRDIVRESGFTDVPLFQCDWSSTFERNGLDDLLWTLNFGTGADIDAQFARLKEVRPDSPLMCSEFWSGWFDHWGRGHETRDAATMVQGIKDMLDRDISFSLYMTHGGSTFGHWGGANCPPYSAMCSSYDYDAPISESGLATPKYMQLRGLLAQYADTALADIPQAMPVIEMPEIKFSTWAPVFDNLPAPAHADSIHPMEYFDQGWGTILYRTTLGDVEKGSVLTITDPCDWAQVYADGKLLGRLDRRHAENSLSLPALPAGTTLDILVEAMGRVNFDEAIHDRKGITRKVEIGHAGGDVEQLAGWDVYSFPVDYEFSADKKYKAVGQKDAPAYYRATFSLDSIGDTFLDMSTWGKGMVWVNGHAIGRFWRIGPQQTLFMPGCWLKKGENEIIVLDLLGPEKASVQGLDHPVLDVLRAEAPVLHRRPGESIDLSGIKPDFKGKVKASASMQTINLKKNAEGRYVCIEMLDPQISVAEINVLGVDGKPLSRAAWKCVYADSEDVLSGNHDAEKVFDLQESTYWTVAPDAEAPHCIVIDLGERHKVGGLTVLPRQDNAGADCPAKYAVYVSSEPFVIK